MYGVAETRGLDLDYRLLEDTNASGVAQADYIYLNGQPIATLDPSTGTVYYLHDDMLGTPQVATDSSQKFNGRRHISRLGKRRLAGQLRRTCAFRDSTSM